jgi:hypothetical protein
MTDYGRYGYLAVDEIMVKFKARVILRQYIPKKHNILGSKSSNLMS